MSEAQDPQALIRNFCIIAHIDHGKSTLADRILETTGAIAMDDMREQVLDAQTLANVNLALGNNLTLVPVINKIDLPAADPERVKEEIEEVLAVDASECIPASAKAGIGIHEIL